MQSFRTVVRYYSSEKDLTGHRVNSVDRFLLKFYKRYPGNAVPDFVPQAMMEKVRSKARIHFNLFMGVATLFGIFVAVYVGKREKEAGISLVTWRNEFHEKQKPNYIHKVVCSTSRTLSSTASLERLRTSKDDCFEASDEVTFNIVKKHMFVFDNFITDFEEDTLLQEIEPHLQRLKYENSHWDNAIKSYREVERKHWTSKSAEILDRVRNFSFPPGSKHLGMVHCLDISADGEIRPHIDSVRFCGTTIAGLSLISSSVLRLVHEGDNSKWVKVLLPSRSLYIMNGEVRYHYTHAILGREESFFKDKFVPRERRLSVMFRVEPSDE